MELFIYIWLFDFCTWIQLDFPEIAVGLIYSDYLSYKILPINIK